MTLILYSTNTWLGYIISQKYYGGVHYIWCTPEFQTNSHSIIDSTTPPTSTPFEILIQLKQEVQRGDRHSAKIKENKIGLLRGAVIRKEQGVITQAQVDDISQVIDNSETRDFRPLLFVIPYEQTKHLLREVPIADRAHPMSVEYVIENLPRDLFDLIEL